MKMFTHLLTCIILVSCSSRQNIKTVNTLDVTPDFTFSSDNGNSFYDAVVVNGVKTQREGLFAEHQYITNIHGQRGQDWFLVGQTIIHDQNKIVDVVEIQLNKSADRKLIYFDATGFLLKN